MEEVKDRIILGTLDLMVNDGVKQTRMDSVDNHLGISKSTIYENFADKNSLITACIEKLIDMQNIETAKVVEGTTDVIEEIFAVLSLLDKRFETYGRISWEVKRLYPDLFKTKFISHYNKSYTNMVNLIERGIKQGYILKNTNVRFAVYVIMTSIHSLMINPEKLFTTTNVSPTESFKYVQIYFFRGISTTKGIEKIDRFLKEKKIYR